MMEIRSKLVPFLTLDYMLREHENKYFDRKSAGIKPGDLARHIVAFANAGGGTLVIGINDKTLLPEGINSFGEEKINDFINAPKQCCRPMPRFREEFIDIINADGAADRLLLLHISESVDQIIRTTNEQTFLRIGDKSRELRGEDLRQLEYAKSSRHFEDELHPDAGIKDLDEELLSRYREMIGAYDLSDEQVLSARGFSREQNGRTLLTNAAVLLFAKNIYRFYSNCRIRFIRYDGSFVGLGTDINIIRDKSIEAPILKIIEEAKDFIGTQLREFTMLDPASGKFRVVPEYPEFAWLEGIVNAVAHREYAMSGSYIKVSMFDDRLEIESPGKLPNIVTVDNIRNTRYSRNPRISRVLTEFGWVRELNEGVKRIYSDMATFFLEAPVYSEPGECVRLVLHNNIVMRSMRQRNRTQRVIDEKIWAQLDPVEQMIITYLVNHGPAGRSQLEDCTNKSQGTVIHRLNSLIAKGLVRPDGATYAPGRKYEALI